MGDVKPDPPKKFRLMDLPLLPMLHIFKTMDVPAIMQASTLSERVKEVVSRVKLPDVNISISSDDAVIHIGEFKWIINKTDKAGSSLLPANTEFGNYHVNDIRSSEWISKTTDEKFDEAISIVNKIHETFPKFNIDELRLNLDYVNDCSPIFDSFDVEKIKTVDLLFNNEMPPIMFEKTKKMKVQGMLKHETSSWMMAENPSDPYGSLHWFTTRAPLTTAIQVMKLDGELLTNADCIRFLKIWENGKIPCCGIMKAEKVKNIDLMEVLKNTDWSPWNDAQMEKYRGIECYSEYFDIKGYVVKFKNEIISIQYLKNRQLFFIIFWDRGFVYDTFFPIKHIF